MTRVQRKDVDVGQAISLISDGLRSCGERLMRVLLAEDDRTIGELMEAALDDVSYGVD
jgi:hypothetical protein